MPVGAGPALRCDGRAPGHDVLPDEAAGTFSAWQHGAVSSLEGSSAGGCGSSAVGRPSQPFPAVFQARCGSRSALADRAHVLYGTRPTARNVNLRTQRIVKRVVRQKARSPLQPGGDILHCGTAWCCGNRPARPLDAPGRGDSGKMKNPHAYVDKEGVFIYLSLRVGM